MSGRRTLSPHQRAAWNALDLGPVWRARAGVVGGPEADAEAGPEAGGTPGVESDAPAGLAVRPVPEAGGTVPAATGAPAAGTPGPSVDERTAAAAPSEPPDAHLFDGPPAEADEFATEPPAQRPPPGPASGDPAAIDPAEVDAAVFAPAPASRVAIARAAVPDAGAASPGGMTREQAIAAMGWPELRASVAGCVACGLCESRQQTVFGVGDTGASWMLIGEAPGAEEDARGEPFVGQAGRLLDAMLAAIGLDRRQDVFITNTLKCRPPGNRNPQPAETAACAPYLRRQIELVQPRLIVALGRFAAQSLLGTDASIGSLRGEVHRLQVGEREVPVVVTYHPAYLLRSLPEKAKAWRDLRLAVGVHDAQG